uniref:Secreted protein n=1 Tax=Picea sitchensis TaxID=3332 RepID=D5A9B0_PICSI|nr:unknown [Picea sitchensis]
MLCSFSSYWGFCMLWCLASSEGLPGFPLLEMQLMHRYKSYNLDFAVVVPSSILILINRFCLCSAFSVAVVWFNRVLGCHLN